MSLFPFLTTSSSVLISCPLSSYSYDSCAVLQHFAALPRPLLQSSLTCGQLSSNLWFSVQPLSKHFQGGCRMHLLLPNDLKVWHYWLFTILWLTFKTYTSASIDTCPGVARGKEGGEEKQQENRCRTHFSASNSRDSLRTSTTCELKEAAYFYRTMLSSSSLSYSVEQGDNFMHTLDTPEISKFLLSHEMRQTLDIIYKVVGIS